MADTARMVEQSKRCQAALAALYGPPMSEDERRYYNELRAAEMARAERRREPSPQLEFGDQ